MIHFQYTEYLLALAAVPLIIWSYFIVVRWKKNTSKKIGDPALVKELTKEYSSKKFYAKFILFSIAFVFCVFAVAGLVKPDASHKINRKGTDIVIALDVSKSMLATDIKPNRLERAKQVIATIIKNSPESKIGLVLFAGKAYLQMPLSFDHAAARMYLSAASTDDVPTQGTVISEALKMSEAAFDPNEKTHKSILLISDGEDHDEEAIKITKQLAKKGIMVSTIGIGTPLGAPLIDEKTGQYKTNKEGKTVITKLNEKELRNIAKEGNGIYQLYTNTEEVAENFKEKLGGFTTETSTNDSDYFSFKQYFQYFLAIAFILLIIEFFISEKKKTKMKGAFLAIFMMMSMAAFSQKNVTGYIADGNTAYLENNYNDAEKNYREALKLAADNATANYNLGNTLYKKGEAEAAAEAYGKAIQSTKDNLLKQKAFYNKGVAYQKAKKLPECILAYKNALMLNPGDEDARQNLQRALKEQQKKNKENNKDKKQQPKKQQKQNQQKKKEPKQNQSKISKEDAIEKLKSLMENEKAIQGKIHKIRGISPVKPEKDW